MKPMTSMWLRLRRSALDLYRDRRGIAAVEFSIIAPVMLLMFFGTVEFSSAIAVDRKVTLVARTLADLPSQSAVPVDNNYLQNAFNASVSILWPYQGSATATLSEIYVDSNQIAKIQWSKGATIVNGQATLATSSRNAGDIVTVPPGLLVKQTYLLFSEVSYLYTPTVGYVMGKAGVTLADVSYTRPRQVTCVTYNNLPAGNCPLP
jgi:Flp pilus assembly protein TadG